MNNSRILLIYCNMPSESNKYHNRMAYTVTCGRNYGRIWKIMEEFV